MRLEQLHEQSWFFLAFSCRFSEKRCSNSQDLSLMPTPSAINKQTIIRIQVRLPGDVDEEGAKQEEGDPMDTEAEAAG